VTARPARTYACPCDCGQQLPAGRVACPTGWDRLPAEQRYAITRAATRRRGCRGVEVALSEYRRARQAVLDWYTHNSSTERADPGYPVDRCASCPARIIWAVSVTTGSTMPVDADPVGSPAGNMLLTPRPGMAPLARVGGNPAGLFGATAIYRSHFAVCPGASRHRRPRRTRSGS
jgi:hypothetical protein